MYHYNICSPIWNQSPSGFKLGIMRYLLLTVLILLFLLYLLITFILKKSISNLKKAEDSGDRLGVKQAFFMDWDREFLLLMGDHSVAVGFVISFSPYQFEVLLSFLFLILRVIYEVYNQKMGRTIKELKTALRIINMALLLCAMVGLSRSEWDKDLQQCRDPTYRLP